MKMSLSLPAMIKQQRTILGITQRELAKKLKVSHGLISHWETRRSEVSDKHKAKLSKALKISLKH